MPADIVGSMVIETQDGGARLRVSARPDLRPPRAGRRDQPRDAEDPVRAAGSDAGEDRHQRHQQHELERPFLVLATQNPIEMEGTYPLPEAQLDRFLMKIVVEYPSRADLSLIVERTIQREEIPLDTIMDRAEILELRRVCRQILVASHVQEHAIDLVMATQPGSSQAHPLARKYIRYGSSPRGAQAMVECGRPLALLRGRLNVSTDDIRELALAVMRHRIILNFDAHADGKTPDSILKEIIASVPAVARA